MKHCLPCALIASLLLSGSAFPGLGYDIFWDTTGQPSGGADAIETQFTNLGNDDPPEISTTDLVRGPGLTKVNDTEKFSSSDWSTGEYITFSVTANPGYFINFSAAEFFFYGQTGSSTMNLALYSSVDGFTDPIGSAVTVLNTIDQNSILLSELGLQSGTVTFRLRKTGGSATQFALLTNNTDNSALLNVGQSRRFPEDYAVEGGVLSTAIDGNDFKLSLVVDDTPGGGTNLVILFNPVTPDPDDGNWEGQNAGTWDAALTELVIEDSLINDPKAFFRIRTDSF